MFVMRGDNAHDWLWGRWLLQAADKYPTISAFRAAECSQQGDQCTCNRQLVQQLVHDCSSESKRLPSRKQHLFSIYTHPSPSYAGFPKGSTFAGTIVDNRIQVIWGSHTMISATRLLLTAALAEPFNQRFVLLGDTAIPLYSPLVTYHQLMTEEKSRVDACGPHGGFHEVNDWRWHDSMAKGTGLQREHWRKSSQWFSLLRHHAEMAATDAEVNAAFETHCYFGSDHEDPSQVDRSCVSDEHYIPTLLAFKNESSQTDCHGELVKATWPGTVPHPVSWTPSDISADFIETQRMNVQECSSHRNTSRAVEMRFTSLADVCSMASQSTEYPPLDQRCPMFARKFPFPTAAKIQALYTNCSSKLSILFSPQEEDSSEGRCDLSSVGTLRRRQSRMQLRRLQSMRRVGRKISRSLFSLVRLRLT
ncbi:hypothetical protein WJX74_006045 [Apatococcus lobatus]|uniref:Uncharacterized protein n=1 Tax=Apatococcus lobatus TaxID=904363 RepID=A0AAW1S665_9CHLO